MQNSANRRTMFELINRYEHGIEAAIQMQTALYHIRVVFEGSKAFTDGRTITLPNVRVFALHDDITDEDVEEARAYFMALRGYAWQQAARIVESDLEHLNAWRAKHGSFAFALVSALDDIRIEKRFGDVAPGIKEAIEYMRETWLWPRYVRKKARGESDIMYEMLVGLQCLLKHSVGRHEHALWKAMDPSAQSWVDRNADDLDSAYDTLKMDKATGTPSLTEVAERMLKRWGEEYALVEPLCPVVAPVRVNDTNLAPRKVQKDEFVHKLNQKLKNDYDDMVGGDKSKTEEQIDDLSAMLTAAQKPPLLMVTIGPRVTTLVSKRFAGGFVQRVERAPYLPEDWEKLSPLAPGETRTLVLHPPDPKLERALDEAMGRMMAEMVRAEREMREKAEEAIEDAKTRIERLPEDQKPYVVYTTRNDKYVQTTEGHPSDLKRMRDEVMGYVGPIKTRLQVLLRSRTRTKRRGNRLEGEEFDPSALVSLAMSKQFPDAELRLFQTLVEQDRLKDTVCHLLVDSSGSMLGTKLKLARHAALCFAEALDLAKFRFAVSAFSSWSGHSDEGYESLPDTERDVYGRFGALYIESCKKFEESWRSVAGRLPRLGEHNDANYDADSVQWAARTLLAQKASRRVLFVFSDGLPASDEPMLQQARQQRHLSDVVAAVAAQGVETVGFGICDNSVRHYYPHHVVVNSASDLPKVVMGQMEFLLLNARKR